MNDIGQLEIDDDQVIQFIKFYPTIDHISTQWAILLNRIHLDRMTHIYDTGYNDTTSFIKAIIDAVHQHNVVEQNSNDFNLNIYLRNYMLSEKGD